MKSLEDLPANVGLCGDLVWIQAPTRQLELGERAIMKGAILANIQNRAMKSKNIHQTDDR